MFLGREKEMLDLEKYYAKDGFGLAIVYGCKRIGKTTIIREFIKDKSYLLFSAEEANDYLNLTDFSTKIKEFFQLPSSMPPFKNCSDAFRFIAQSAKNKKIVIAIDEYPYAAIANKSLNSMLQHVIDYEFKETSLFMILCGSQMGFTVQIR